MKKTEVKVGFPALAEVRLSPAPRAAQESIMPGAVLAEKLSVPPRILDNPIEVPAGTVALQAAIIATYTKQDTLITLYFRYTPLVGGGTGPLHIMLPYPAAENQPYAIALEGSNLGTSIRTVAFDARTSTISFTVPAFSDYYELQLEYETDYNG